MSGGSDNITQTTEPPSWAVPHFQNYLQQGGAVASQPYTPYTGARVADYNPVQYGAMDAITQRAMQGTPEASAGRNELTNTLSGGYLGTQAPTNAYMGAQNQQAGVSNQMAGVANPQAGAVNPQMNAANPNAGVRNEAAGVQNAYAGSNPFLQQMIDATQGDVVRNYNLTTRPGFGTANARSGSFGNAGLAEMENESQRQLAGELGRISSGMRMQDYTTQQGLAENAANRQFQAGEGLAGRLYGAGSQQAGQQFQSGENFAGRLFGAGQQQSQNLYNAGQQQANQLFSSGENFANRLFQGGETQAGRQQTGYESERARMMGALGQVPQYGAMDYQDAAQMLGVGDALQRQQQSFMDDDYTRFTEARDYPLRQLDILGRTLGGANYGQSGTSTQPGPNRAAGGIGGALAGASLSNMLMGSGASAGSTGVGAGLGALLGLFGG